MEDTSREAASCDIDLDRLEGGGGVSASRRRAGEAPSDTSDRSDTSDMTHAVLGGIVANVARWLRGASDLDHPRCPLRPHGFERWMAVWSGGGAVARQMRDMGLDPDSVAAAEEAKRQVAKEANDAKTPADRRVSGAALGTGETLLTAAGTRFTAAGVSGAVHDRLRDSRVLPGRSRRDSRTRRRLSAVIQSAGGGPP